MRADGSAAAQGDITLPDVHSYRTPASISETFNEIADIFISLGFQVVESNDVN